MGTRIAVTGIGAVSPAGWGVEPLSEAITGSYQLPVEELEREGRSTPISVRKVPKPEQPPAFLRDPRLRRTSVVGKYGVAAALEALGDKREQIESGELRTGIVFCEMNGIVDYSRRFYSQVLDDPAFASPILFPETVYNAPSSHLSALLGSHEINYTLLGDSSQFIAGMDAAARWLSAGKLDACLVVSSEELDWLSAEAFQMFEPNCPVTEGAAAILLEKRESVSSDEIELAQIAGPMLYRREQQGESFDQQRLRVGSSLRQNMEATDKSLLVDGLLGNKAHHDKLENRIWQGWQGEQVSPLQSMGAAFSVGAGWQCIVAAKLLSSGQSDSAVVSAIGGNQQAAAALLRNGIE